MEKLRKVRKYRSTSERDYILKMLLLARSQTRFSLSEKDHADVIKRARKDYAAASKAAEKSL